MPKQKLNFFEVLGVISVVLFLAGFLFYLIGLGFYLDFNLTSPNAQAYSWFDTLWLPLLIVSPFFIQFAIFFRFLNKSRDDLELNVFFKVYSKFMCIGLTLYSLIWCIYNITLVINPKEQPNIDRLVWWLTFFSILSVVFILSLVWVIINCTRIITRDSFEKNEGLFNSSDLTIEEYYKLCDKLDIISKHESLLESDEAKLRIILTTTKKTDDEQKKLEEERKKISEIITHFSSFKNPVFPLGKNSAKLNDVMAVLTDARQPVQIKPLKRVLSFLKEDNNIWIHKAIIGHNFRADVPKYLLIKSLNKILKNPEFFESKEFSTKEEETPVESAARYFEKHKQGIFFTEQVQLENRKLFDEHIIKALKAQNPDSGEKTFQQKDSNPSTFKDLLAKKGSSLLKLGFDDHTDLKIKEGIARFPFDIMSFFFTIFLCITYLFGFSFAFHDRSNLLSTKTKTPALFMAADYLDKSANDAAANPAKTPDRQPTFFLFYEPADSGIKTEAVPVNNQVSPTPQKKNSNTNTDMQQQQLQLYRYLTNRQNFDDLLNTIKQRAYSEKRVYVEIVGRADDASVKDGSTASKQTYSSNYELSQARAQNLKFELMRQLQNNSSILEKIEWTCLPVSNDESLGSDYPLNDPNHRPSIALNSYAPSPKILNNEKKSKDPKQINKDIIDRIDKASASEIWEVDSKKDPGQREKLIKKRELLDKQVERAKILFSQGKITNGRDGETLFSNLQEAFGSYSAIANETKDNLKFGTEEYEKKQNEFDSLQKKIEDALNFYQSGANNANKRVTEVYVTSIPKNDYIVSSVELNLMDYILYSITTIGYGDIKPTTMYAKFLCILVSIIEIFFVVVFFNILMSVKRVNNEDDLISSS